MTYFGSNETQRGKNESDREAFEKKLTGVALPSCFYNLVCIGNSGMDFLFAPQLMRIRCAHLVLQEEAFLESQPPTTSYTKSGRSNFLFVSLRSMGDQLFLPVKQKVH